MRSSPTMVDNHSETVHPLPQVKRDGTLLLPRTFELLNPKNLHMKKSLLSLVLIGACGATMAQRIVTGGTRIPSLEVSGSRTPTDTISFVDANADLTVFTAQSGFAVGTNNFGDQAKAQTFLLNDAVSAEAVGVWFGGKVAGPVDPSSSVAFKIYQNNGPGFISGSPTPTTITTGAPNDEWASVDVPFADCDTSLSFTLTWGTFSSPVYVTDFFSAGVDFTGLAAGDSLGIVSTEDGQSIIPDFSWEKWSASDPNCPNCWFTLNAAWPLDIDILIFVAIDASNVGIDDAGTMNGMRMSFLNGNLVGQDLELAYTVDHSANMQLMVFDASGRRILHQQFGNQSAGLYNETINASAWSAGTYHVALVADGRTLTKKIVKQ
jgi:hypothetical protein